MRVGVPKEIKKNEHRVGLTPTAVREYVAHGHTVSVQAGAGIVYNSVPEREFEETCHKARAMKAAVLMAANGLKLE